VMYVVDSVLITYAGNEFIGGFNSFTLDEAGEDPYSINYNFEYVISGIRGTPVEGHLRMRNRSTDDARWNTENSRVILGVQGSDTKFAETLFMDKKEQNIDLRVNESTLERNAAQARNYAYTIDEFNEELAYWQDKAGRKITDGSVVISSTNGKGTSEPRPKHDGKIDYRTSTSFVRSLYGGTIVEVRTSDHKGGPNYVIVQSEYPVGSGEFVFARYYHMDTRDLRARGLTAGQTIPAGFILGREGTDNGAFTEHCDLEIKAAFSSHTTQYINQSFVNKPRIDATKFFVDGVNGLAAQVPKTGTPATLSSDHPFYEYTTINFRHNTEVFGNVTWDKNVTQGVEP